MIGTGRGVGVGIDAEVAVGIDAEVDVGIDVEGDVRVFIGVAGLGGVGAEVAGWAGVQPENRPLKLAAITRIEMKR
jgi:hypothetical protein